MTTSQEQALAASRAFVEVLRKHLERAYSDGMAKTWTNVQLDDLLRDLAALDCCTHAVRAFFQRAALRFGSSAPTQNAPPLPRDGRWKNKGMRSW